MVKNPAQKTTRIMRRSIMKDFRDNALQFLAMAFLCFLGTWVFAGLDGSWRLMDKTMSTYYAETNLTDLWVNDASIEAQDIAAIRHLDGVAEVQVRSSVTVDAVNLGDGVEIALEAYEGAPVINTPYLRSGELLKSNDIQCCLVEEQFAEAHNLVPGDSLTMKIMGQEISFRIKGLVFSSEYTQTSRDVVPTPETYGFVIIVHGAVPLLPYTTVLVKLESGYEVPDLQERISALKPSAIIVTGDTQKDITLARGFVEMFKGLTYFFPLLTFAVATLIVVTTLRRMVDRKRLEIGTLKSQGYHEDEIRRIYILYAIVPSLVGSVAGTVVGWYTLPKVVWDMITSNASYPYVLWPNISLRTWLITGVSVLFSVTICVITLNQSLKETTAELLRPKPPKAGDHIALERWKSLWQRLSFNSKMIVRNLFRNKGRTVIMLVGVLCCNMLIITTFGLLESIKYFMARYYGETLCYDVRVELTQGEADRLESYVSRLEADEVSGVMEKSVSLKAPQDTRVCLLTVLKDDEDLYRIGKGQTVLQLPEDGLCISEKLAKLMKIKIGDSVELLIAGERDTVTMEVKAFAETYLGQGLFLSETAWKTCRKGAFIPTAILLKGPSELCMSRLSQSDAVDSIKTLQYQYDQSITILDATALAFSILAAVALALAFTICYTMGNMNFIERGRDYATLKVLGYHQQEIRSLMLRESGLIGILGTLLGIVPGVLLVKIILKLCEYDSMVFVAHTTLKTIVLSSIITFLFTVFIELLLTRKVKTIDMVEALKSVE